MQDGYTAKLLHPDTPTGRQARYETLELLLRAVYPDGYVLTIRPRREGASESVPNRFGISSNAQTDQRGRATVMKMGRGDVNPALTRSLRATQ